MKIKQFGLLGLLVSAGIVFADDFEPVLDTIPEVDEDPIQDNNPVDHEPRINDGVVDGVKPTDRDGTTTSQVKPISDPLKITLATDLVHSDGNLVTPVKVTPTPIDVTDITAILDNDQKGNMVTTKPSLFTKDSKKISALLKSSVFKNFPDNPGLLKQFEQLTSQLRALTLSYKQYLDQRVVVTEEEQLYNRQFGALYVRLKTLSDTITRYNLVTRNNQALDAFFKQPLLTLIMKKSSWWSFSKNPYSKQRLQLQNLRNQLLTDPNQFVKIMKQMDNVVDQVKALRTKDANTFLLKASKQGNVRIRQDQINSFVNGEITLKELKALNTQSVVANVERKKVTNQLKAVVQQQKADTDLVNEYMQLTNQKQILTDQQQDTLQSILSKLEPVVNGLGDTAPEALKQLLANAQNVQKVQMFELYTSTNTNVQQQLYFSSESLDIPKAQQVLLEAQAVLKKISDQTQKSILEALIAKLVTKIKNAKTAQGAKTDVAEAV